MSKSIVFGWTEPHAVAGHAALLTGGDGCLLCHFEETGLPKLKVAKWEQETMLSEPACGGSFQPYGPVEIMAINSMIASLAIDSLVFRWFPHSNFRLLCSTRSGRVEDWRRDAVGLAYPLLPVSFGSASIAGP
jgi:hypothetical protein